MPMTEQDVVTLVQAEATRLGSMRALAREWGISPAYVSDLLQGRRAPGPKILGPLGLRAVRTLAYERTPRKAK
jgi:hypothetical protein